MSIKPPITFGDKDPVTNQSGGSRIPQARHMRHQSQIGGTNMSLTQMFLFTFSTDDVPYNKTILIVRNPYDAIKAEFNRQKAGKTGRIDDSDYQHKGKVSKDVEGNASQNVEVDASKALKVTFLKNIEGMLLKTLEVTFLKMSKVTLLKT